MQTGCVANGTLAQGLGSSTRLGLAGTLYQSTRSCADAVNDGGTTLDHKAGKGCKLTMLRMETSRRRRPTITGIGVSSAWVGRERLGNRRGIARRLRRGSYQRGCRFWVTADLPRAPLFGVRASGRQRQQHRRPGVRERQRRRGVSARTAWAGVPRRSTHLPALLGASAGAVLLLTLPQRVFSVVVAPLIILAVVLVIIQPWLRDRIRERSPRAALVFWSP